MTGIPLKGNLKDTRLPLILIHINRNRLTGTLEVRTSLFTKKIYLVKGDAIFASSTYEDDRLGEMLLKIGKITLEQFDQAAEKLKKSKKRLGAILVELGFINPKELFWAVKYQVKEIIYSIFQIEEGDYEFIEGDVPSDEVITLKMSMGNLIYEGVKRIDSLTRIRREMPSMSDVLMLSDDPLSLFQDIELSAQDKKLLSLVDGEKTIKEVLDSSWMGSFEAMKILYVLYYTGILVKKERPEDMVETITVDDLLKELSEDEKAFEKRVDEFMKKIQAGDPYDLLELERGADSDSIKGNYFRLAREFHPDKYYESEDSALKDKLTTIFDAITDAYNRLKEQSGQETVATAATPAAPTDGRDADTLLKQGIAGFKKGDFAEAARLFRAAVEANGKDARAWSYLSLALSKMPDSIKQAEEALIEAINLEPDNADYLANLGILYMKEGVHQRARTQFEKALTLDPANRKAQKGLKDLQLLGRRKKAGP